MYCQKCGKELADGATVCASCGAETTNSVIDREKAEHFVPDEGLDQFFSLKGRLNRWRYFKRLILISLISGLVILGAYEVLDYDEAEIFSVVIACFIVWPEYCLDVRRLKDMNQDDNKAGEAACCSLVTTLLPVMSDDLAYFIEHGTLVGGGGGGPIVIYLMALLYYIYLALYFLFKGGTRGKNRFGPDPLENVH